jgi:uncharacterized membrane protein HdeD (DUF308 family)
MDTTVEDAMLGRPAMQRLRSTPKLDSAFHRAWMLVTLRGLLAVFVSAVLLTRPSMARGLLLMTLGIYLGTDGLLALGTALRGDRGAPGRGRYLIEGLLSLVVAGLALARPSAFETAVFMLIAARSVIVGLVEIATAVSLRRSGGERHWPIGLGGLASLGFGAYLFARPASGVLVLVLLAGVYVLVFGVSLLTAGFRLRRAYTRIRTEAHA